MGTSTIEGQLVLSIPPTLLGPGSEYDKRRLALKKDVEQLVLDASKITQVTTLEELEQAKANCEAETKSKRYTVTEDNVAEVVSMMTGIPVQRVGQADSLKLLNMAEAAAVAIR